MSETNDRLARIEQLLIQTAEIAAENTRSIQMQRTINAEYDRQSKERMDNLMDVVQQSAEYQDKRNADLDQLMQTFIDEGKADRAEAQRQRSVFTETIQSLVAQLVGRMNQIAERIEQIWSKINAA